MRNVNLKINPRILIPLVILLVTASLYLVQNKVRSIDQNKEIEFTKTPITFSDNDLDFQKLEGATIYEGELKKVITDKETASVPGLDGFKLPDSIRGTVKTVFHTAFVLQATIENLPPEPEGFYYNGWLSKKTDAEYKQLNRNNDDGRIDTGVLIDLTAAAKDATESEGADSSTTAPQPNTYTNNFVSEKDYKEYSIYYITLESDRDSDHGISSTSTQQPKDKLIYSARLMEGRLYLKGIQDQLE